LPARFAEAQVSEDDRTFGAPPAISFAAPSLELPSVVGGDESQVMPAMLRAALELAELAGVRIALAHHLIDGKRCSCGEDCGSPGKHPLRSSWQKSASAAPELIRAWFARDPHANFGIATGVASGVVVLDVDGAEGAITLANLVAKHGPLPVGPRAQTARGVHIYFAAGSVPLHNRAGDRGRGLGKGLDLRAEGGFVVAPPSVHASGVAYRWQTDLKLGEVELPALPQWIVDAGSDAPRPAPTDALERVERRDFEERMTSRAEKWALSALEREGRAVRGAPEGARNATLNTAAFNLGMLVASNALDGSTVRAALMHAAMEAGLSEFEAAKTIKSGMAAGIKKDSRSAPVSVPVQREMSGVTTEPRDGTEPAAEPQFKSAMQPRFNTLSLFATLPAQRWCVPGLQLGPGRPTLIAGYGASAKTLASQSLALSLASGRPVWERFDSSPMRVLHVDYEQTYFATAKRYQRLALGHGIDPRELSDRLEYVEMPRVYLDRKSAEEEYLQACNGFDLVIIDALRGAAPHTDENDSSFRASVDVLTYVSQRTGCSVLLLHHASKPKKDAGGDGRSLARGSSAIFDASGCVLNFVAKPGDAARLVQQVKMPAEAEGSALDPFELVVEDVAIGGSASGGVKVVWRQPVPVDESAKASEEFERHAALIMKAVRRMPEGQSSNAIVARCGVHRNRALDVLRALADEGRVELVAGKGRSKLYRLAVTGGDR
jgi:hypothetical protein